LKRSRRTPDAADDHLRVPNRSLAAVEAEAGRTRLDERFEMFAGQMEIANGFSELNDPKISAAIRGQLKSASAATKRPPDG